MRPQSLSPRFALSMSIFATALICAPHHAGADAIVVRSEAGDCFITDNVGVHTMTVLHVFNSGSVASRFKIEPVGGLTMPYLGETHAWNSLGTMISGITMCYGECVIGDTVIGTISYFGVGTSHSCAQLVVKPHPDAETIDIISCGNQPEAASTLHFEILGPQNQGCGWCGPHDPGISYPGTAHSFGCQPLPTRQSTWGAVKALYQ